MRFGRKAKQRNLDRLTEKSADSGGSVATEERSALLSFPGPTTVVAEPDGPVESTGDPTQELLSTLGRYQALVGEVGERGADSGQWTDDVMDQLVEALGVAIQHEWDVVVEALTDAGRILHAYEDAGQSKNAAPFLREAYDILCLMVGDLIVGDVRESVTEKWHQCYGTARAAADSISPEPESADIPGDKPRPSESLPDGEVMPFDMPDEGEGSAAALDDALPALDEMPRLNEMIEAGIEAQPSGDDALPAENGTETDEALELFADFDNVTYLETKDSEPAPPEPTKLMVEILDRICDQLSLLERSEGEEFSLHIERATGGVGALKLEAELAESPAAIEACALMEDALIPAAASMGKLDKHFMDVAYAFCGVYIDAIKEEGADSATQWKKEALSLVETWEDPVSDEEKATAPTILAEEEEADAEVAPDTAEIADESPLDEERTDSTSVPEAIVILEIPEEGRSDAGAPEPESTEDSEGLPTVTADPDLPSDAVDLSGENPDDPVEATDEADTVPEKEEAPSNSFALLESAQKAAAKGDGMGARHFALQAAAQIAADETARAELHLESTEAKLKQSWDASASAREEVTHSEQAVTDAASKVSGAESGLGLASDLRAESAQEVSDLAEKVLDLEEQMKALVERHKEEERNVGEAKEKLDGAESAETEADEALAKAADEEKSARVQLETARHGVKELQRRSAEIESEVSGARENLSRQKNSLEDIEGTIAHISGAGKPTDSPDTLLF